VAKDGNVQPALDLVAKAYEKREEELTPEILRQLERYLLLNAIDGRWKDHLHAIDALKAGIGLRGYGQVDPKTEYKREGFQLFEQLLQAIEDEVTSLILRIKISRPDRREGQEGEASGEAAKAAAAVPQPKGIEPSAAAVARARAAAARPRPVQYVPASRAFDVAKRQQMIAQMQQRAQPATPPAAAETPSGAEPAAQTAGETNGDATSPQPVATPRAAQAPAPKPAAQRAHVPAVGRNDPCPCGSGQKYKKCHGKGG